MKDQNIPSNLPKSVATKVEHWDDERGIGNSLIVTLHYGWSFEDNNHEGVQGFDTKKEAIVAIRGAVCCQCAMCERHAPSFQRG